FLRRIHCRTPPQAARVGQRPQVAAAPQARRAGPAVMATMLRPSGAGSAAPAVVAEHQPQRRPVVQGAPEAAPAVAVEEALRRSMGTRQGPAGMAPTDRWS